MGRYYQIINEENQSYKAALQLINDASAYTESLTS